MDKLDVLKEEMNHAREAVSRTMGSVYAVFGITLPAAIAALALFGKDTLGSDRVDILGFVGILVLSIAITYTNALTVEAHQYLRYMYIELMPRMYKISGLESHANFFQYRVMHTSPYSNYTLYLYSVLVVIGVLCVGLMAILADFDQFSLRTFGLLILSIFSIAIAVCSSAITRKSQSVLASDLRESFEKNNLSE